MPQEGDKFGYYHLKERLGSGGFAEVWLGEHILMQYKAAIKILHKLELPTDQEREKFLDEARHLAGLSHDNIVRVLECGLEVNTPFLVLEYAPNGTLRTRHPKGTRLPMHLILEYVEQIAAGLQYAHNRRLIHRDVKPENMLVGKSNQVLISDFGIAAVEKTSSFRKAQSQDIIMGTTGYMAPEQFDGNPTTATDQYALGIVVYEWLCGALPFKGTAVDIRTQQKLKPPQLRDKVPGISSALEQVVLTALSEDLNARFRDVQTFADELEKAANANNPIIQIQMPGNQISANNPLAAGRLPLNDPLLVNPVGGVGGANNPFPVAKPGIPNASPNDPFVPNQVGGVNNLAPDPTLLNNPFGNLAGGINNAPSAPDPMSLNNPFVVDPAGGANNPPPDPGVQNGPVRLNPGGANNPLDPTLPVGVNNPFQGIPLTPDVPFSPFHSGATVQAGGSIFESFAAQPTQTSGQRKRVKLFDGRAILSMKNRLFVFGGGLVDFILAIALGLWLNAGDISWNLWLGSVVCAWAARAACAATTKKYIAIPLALALGFYWFIGSWAFGTAFNAKSHINAVPPHIIAILMLFIGSIVHLLYANKKK